MANTTKYRSIKKTQQSLRCKLLIVIVTIILLLAVILAVVFVVLLRTSSQDDLIEVSKLIRSTRCGPVQGIIEKSSTGQEALVFRGIPYAKPPTGQRRWKPPEDLDRNRPGKRCWDGVYNATKFGPMCTQAKILNPFRGQEDCLYLNVWKQRNTNTSLMPVFVWIHGGGFLVGNGNFPGYAPNAHFIRKLGVVAVSMNYRLGPFGFMSLDVLSKNTSSNSSGNYALMDIIQSLKWVQNNIRFFGGDPNLVTIVGHSAGGKAVYALLASPLAAGLFHRAVVMSGPPVYVKTFAETARDNAVFVDRANCSRYTDEETLRCLYNLTVEEVYDAVPWNVFPFWFQDDGYDLPTKDKFMAALAVVDPVVVPVSPLNLTNATDPNSSVPVLITTTAEETDVAATRNISSNGTKPLKQKVNKYLSTFSPALTNDALKHYLPKNRSRPYDAAYTYIRMSTDVRVTCPTNEALRRMTAPGRGPKYQMVVENKPNKTVTIYTSTHVYAYHGWDTFALFGFVRSVYGNISVSFEPTEEDFRFRDGIQREFAHFVRYGHPKQKSWSPFPRAVAVYTDTGIVVQNTTYNEEQCKFWDANNFFPYGWML